MTTQAQMYAKAQRQLDIGQVCEDHDLSEQFLASLFDLLDCQCEGWSAYKVGCELDILAQDIPAAAADKLSTIFMGC